MELAHSPSTIFNSDVKYSTSLFTIFKGLLDFGLRDYEFEDFYIKTIVII